VSKVKLSFLNHRQLSERVLSQDSRKNFVLFESTLKKGSLDEALVTPQNPRKASPQEQSTTVSAKQVKEPRSPPFLFGREALTKDQEQMVTKYLMKTSNILLSNTYSL